MSDITKILRRHGWILLLVYFVNSFAFLLNHYYAGTNSNFPDYSVVIYVAGLAFLLIGVNWFISNVLHDYAEMVQKNKNQPL